MDELALLAERGEASVAGLVHCGGDRKGVSPKNNSFPFLSSRFSRIISTDPYDWLMMRCLTRTHTYTTSWNAVSNAANHSQGDKRLDIIAE